MCHPFLRISGIKFNDITLLLLAHILMREESVRKARRVEANERRQLCLTEMFATNFEQTLPLRNKISE